MADKAVEGSRRGLELRIPPVALVLLSAAFMWALDAAGAALDFELAGKNTLAAALAVLGVAVTGGGLAAFRSARTTVNPMQPEEASALVVRGVYRVTRNPMYLGFLFLLLAWAAYLANIGALLVVAAFVVYMNRFQIAPEERALAALFGAQFEDYKRRVRRWI
jgi:protein-S-isoprenylcysteine O-methyltransferase Ste14